jgi:hypothetical protein
MSGDDDEVYDLADRGDDRPGLEDVDLEEDSSAGVEGAVLDPDEDDEDEEDDDEDDLDDDELTISTTRLRRRRLRGRPHARTPGGAGAQRRPGQRLRRTGAAAAVPATPGHWGWCRWPEFFVATRVRGRHVQVVLSDVHAAESWTLARDVIDYLNVEVPDDTTRTASWATSTCSPTSPVGDGVDVSAPTSTRTRRDRAQVAEHIHFGPQARKAADSFE